MPIYEYACSHCGKTSDVFQKLSDPAPEQCPACGAEKSLSRVVSRTSFVLKGGGWYSDLYASNKKAEAPAAEGAKPADAPPAATSSTAPPAAGATSSAGGSPNGGSSGGTSSGATSSPTPAKTTGGGEKT